MFPERRQWSLPAVLRRAAEDFGEHPFLSFGLGERELTYADAHAESDAVAAGLRRLGVGPGDNVLLMLRNRPEFVLSWFAANKLGAVQVPVNIDYRGHLLEHLANTARAGLLVVESDLLEQVLASADSLQHLRRVVVVGEVPGRTHRHLELLPFPELLQPADLPPVEVQAHHLAAIHFTSGTTGPAKGATVTHAHQHLLAEKFRALVDLGPGDVNLTHLPFFHINAQIVGVYASMLVGARVRVEPHFSASGWVGHARRSQATVTWLQGVMLPFIMEQPSRPDDDDNVLRSVAAVPRPPGLAEKFQGRFGVERVVSCSGNTEVGMVTRFDEDTPAGSCGRPDDEWYEIRIVAPELDEAVPVGETGELVVRPRHPWTVTQGYFGAPEATLEAFRNLWFHTGDGFCQDADGYLYFVDRVKDRIRRRGENVPTGDVELILTEHPAIADAAIVAVPSDIESAEDEIKACLVLHQGAILTAGEMFAWCDQHLPRFALPRYIEFFDSLPKTPTGKVRKHLLREEGVTPTTATRP